MCTNFQIKLTTLNFWTQICPKMNFWGTIFKNLSLHSTSTPSIYHSASFKSKWTTFIFLAQIWGNCPISCNILIQMLLRVLWIARRRLKWDGWMWMELVGGLNVLGGGGWRLSAQFSNTHCHKFKYFTKTFFLV